MSARTERRRIEGGVVIIDPPRKATPRDRRRLNIYLAGGHYCGAEKADFLCSLKPRHQGNHESWRDEPVELCAEWPT